MTDTQSSRGKGGQSTAEMHCNMHQRVVQRGMKVASIAATALWRADVRAVLHPGRQHESRMNRICKATPQALERYLRPPKERDDLLARPG